MDSEVRLNMRTLITNQPLRRLVLVALLSALVAGCGSGTISSSNFNGSSGGSPGGDTLTGGGGGTGGGDTGTGGTSVSCTSPGLAAEDLSGQCRAAPQATMGALEAVSG